MRNTNLTMKFRRLCTDLGACFGYMSNPKDTNIKEKDDRNGYLNVHNN